MEKYIDDFIRTMEAKGLSKSHTQAYKMYIEEFCKGLKQPTEIKEKVVMNYFYTVQTMSFSKANKYKRFGSVKAFCEYLMSINKLILNSKCLLFRVEKSNTLPRGIWSEREINQLISSITDKRLKRLKAIIELAYSCGLRLNEIIKADLFDLDLNERTFLVKECKGKDRLLPVNEKAIEAIQEYLIVRKRTKLKTTALFVTSNGERLHNCNVIASIARLGVRKKIGKKLTIHTIRHSIATHLLQAGMDIALISQFLGHSHLTTTTIYTRIAINDLKKMIDKYHPRNSLKID